MMLLSFLLMELELDGANTTGTVGLPLECETTPFCEGRKSVTTKTLVDPAH